jgi:hypothetical protein
MTRMDFPKGTWWRKRKDRSWDPLSTAGNASLLPCGYQARLQQTAPPEAEEMQADSCDSSLSDLCRVYYKSPMGVVVGGLRSPAPPHFRHIS